MNHISSRVYKNKEDSQLIFDLLTRVRPAKFRWEYPTKTDLEEHLASSKIQARTRLWFDEDRLIAWAYVDDFRNLLWEIERPYDQDFGDEIIDWGVLSVRLMNSNTDDDTLDTSCREDDVERIEFLEKHGFQQTENITVHMERDLAQPVSKPELSKGFVIRPIKGFEEAEAIASLHRLAFSTGYMTAENRLAIMKTSDYDPSLDLIAVAPNGTLAAYCTCSVNLKDRIGSTDPVATHPNYQRLGLARALLLTGLSLLKERGMHSASLGTDGNNIAMQKAAESVGFKILHKIIWFEKRIISK